MMNTPAKNAIVSRSSGSSAVRRSHLENLTSNPPSYAQSTAPLPTLLNPKQAARLLGISIPTLRRLIQARQIQYYKISGSIRFGVDDVRAYLQSRHVEHMRMGG